MVESKELNISKDDKFELELIVADLNAKSLRMFLADLFSAWVSKVRKGEAMPPLQIIKEVGHNGMVIVHYSYVEDIAYFARKQAALNRTSLTNYFRSIIHWLCEQHRQGERSWIDDTPWEEIPIVRRK